MPNRDAISIGTDRQTELSITVSLREEHSYGAQKSLKHTITAPLFMLSGLNISEIAQKLYKRVIEQYCEELYKDQMKESDESEDAHTEGTFVPAA